MNSSYPLACLIYKSLSDFNVLKIRKLVFISDGWNLAISGEALTLDRPVTGEFGPLYPALESVLGCAGYVPANEFSNVPASAAFHEEQLKVISKVIDVYADFEAHQLSVLTKSKPWESTYLDHGINARIPDSKITEYFRSLVATKREADVLSKCVNQ